MSFLAVHRKEFIVVITACRKEAEASFPLPLPGAYRSEGATLANRLASSRPACPFVLFISYLNVELSSERACESNLQLGDWPHGGARGPPPAGGGGVDASCVVNLGSHSRYHVWRDDMCNYL